METKLAREVSFLKIYSAIATLVCAVFFLSAFVMQGKKQKFEEIDVERINIVDDFSVVIALQVLSNY